MKAGGNRLGLQAVNCSDMEDKYEIEILSARLRDRNAGGGAGAGPFGEYGRQNE